MKRKFQSIYQFKVTLKGIKPPIWRRIQVPENYTFWDLHCAIQDAMGWYDGHLHLFEIINPRNGRKEVTGIPNKDVIFDRRKLVEWKVNITDFFNDKNKKAYYLYDFGDNWEHQIMFEKIVPAQEGVVYPQCIAGKRECPPEDCGGIWGYEDFLTIIMDPEHEQYEEMLDWAGDEFDPEHFDKDDIFFADSAKRLKWLLEE